MQFNHLIRHAPILPIICSSCLSLPVEGAERAREWDRKYCVPVSFVNLNPFREIQDGKELAYLLLLRSYISTDSNETGILQSYEFSPDGKTFTGRLVPDLRWSDGSVVTPLEAAFGIAKTMRFRTLGKRAQVLGTEDIDSVGWEKKKYSGIEILDSHTFRLKFISKIANLTGVLREALSTNSRHNRFWPIKIFGLRAKKAPLVLAKFPQLESVKNFVLSVGGERLLVADQTACFHSDYAIFPEVLGSKPDSYLLQMSPSPSAISIQVNTGKIDLKGRKTLVNWVRAAFKDLPRTSGISSVSAFFLLGESGFNQSSNWTTKGEVGTLAGRRLRIAYEIPIFRTILQQAAKRSGIQVEFVPLPTQDSDLDAQILASGIQEGRHLILQDALRWPHVSEFLRQAPKTKWSLQQIAVKSASTLPPDSETLKQFELNAIEEQSLAPVARKFPIAYSKRSLKTCLAWTEKGELTFLPVKNCTPTR